MRTRERAHEATIVFVVIVILVGTSTSLDDDRGDVDAETTREDDRDRARAFGATRRVGAIVANGMTTSEGMIDGPPRQTPSRSRRPMASVEDGDDDARAREDECEALRAIYGDENVAFARVRDGREDDTVVELALGDGAWRASATLPVGYPSARAPMDAYALAVRERGAREREVEAWASSAMERVWVENLREPCVYAWAEAVMARAEAAAREDGEEEGGGDGVDASTSEPVSLEDVEAELAVIEAAAATPAGTDAARERRDDVRRRLTSHEPVTEKKSVFQAHVCRGVESVDEVEMVMDILNESRKVRAATHNILAYRVSRPDGTFYQDHDDDGETAAGGRLLRLLVLADARNVVVVVSRWYGGVHLGPARFHVINTAAKVALESLGEIHQST